MGHNCHVCGRHRPNEKFSGRGHARHVCQDCARRPKAGREREEIEEELWGCWFQSNLSKKNLVRLEALESHRDAEIRTWASLLREVGLVHPRRRGRLSQLRKKRPDLLERLVALGFVEERAPDEEAEEPKGRDDGPWEDDWNPFEGCYAGEDPDPDDVPF
ncbi:MAG: hypothetical protein HZB55_07950 [Deltaproteobacteria bacterium]|nr:hypothetical protein [Deltaproteobacteria bacterium]